jgi:hypothetical protein
MRSGDVENAYKNFIKAGLVWSKMTNMDGQAALMAGEKKRFWLFILHCLC